MDENRAKDREDEEAAEHKRNKPAMRPESPLIHNPEENEQEGGVNVDIDAEEASDMVGT